MHKQLCESSIYEGLIIREQLTVRHLYMCRRSTTLVYRSRASHYTPTVTILYTCVGNNYIFERSVDGVAIVHEQLTQASHVDECMHEYRSMHEVIITHQLTIDNYQHVHGRQFLSFTIVCYS